MDEKGLGEKVEKIMYDITSGIVTAAMNRAQDPERYLFESCGLGKNGIPESTYKNLYKPAHWHLMNKNIISLQMVVPWGEKSYWKLKDGNNLDLKNLVSEIMNEYGTLLKLRYLQVRTEEEMEKLISADDLH